MSENSPSDEKKHPSACDLLHDASEGIMETRPRMFAALFVSRIMQDHLPILSRSADAEWRRRKLLSQANCTCDGCRR